MTPLGLPHSLGHVFHLRKALYGLIQAPRPWFFIFTSAIHAVVVVFSMISYDPVMFTHPSGNDDDMIIIGGDFLHIMQVKEHLHTQFEIK